MAETSSIPEPETYYAMFVGAIDQSSAKKIADAIGLMINPSSGVTQAKFAFQSSGGIVGDGVFLYNLFRTSQLDLTLYNIGQVSSIATTSFLGASKRKACASAMFMLHRSARIPGQPTTASRAKLMAETLRLEDERTETILRQHLRLTAEQWEIHAFDDLMFSAQDALAAGLIDEIVDFAPPKGQPVWSI